MKKAAVFIALSLSLVSLCAEHLAAGSDKFKHFGVSLLFGTAGESLFHYTTDWKDKSLIGWGAAAGTLPGLVKEILDGMEEGNPFSGPDLAANFAGALPGNIFNNQIRIYTEKEKSSRLISVSVCYTF